MKKLMAIVFAIILLTSFVGCNNNTAPFDSKVETDQITSVDDSVFTMLRCPDWSDYFESKNFKDCELTSKIIDELSKLKETGVPAPKISDDELDKSMYNSQADVGTTWIECGSLGLFRLNREMNKISKVESHLGSGKYLEMTDELEKLLKQAWYYYPRDYWKGEYSTDGSITLDHVYDAESAVESVQIKNITLSPYENSADNSITLSILASKTENVRIELESYQSDDVIGAAGSSAQLELIKGQETEVTLGFGNYYHSYTVVITLDSTTITIHIHSGSKL